MKTVTVGLPINASTTRPRATRRVAAMVLGVAALLGALAPAAARPRLVEALASFDSQPSAFPAQRGGISLAQATAMASGRFQGRVVRAETVSRGDRTIHEIRILGDDGRVRSVRIDAQSGSFL
jgi:uncharacterized membrane protein YkoI